MYLPTEATVNRMGLIVHDFNSPCLSEKALLEMFRFSYTRCISEFP